MATGRQKICVNQLIDYRTQLKPNAYSLHGRMITLVTGTIHSSILEQSPDFKMGIITYNHITVKETPQMMQGRLQLFYEEKKWELEDQNVADTPGIKEWRDVFKRHGTDPSRYRPSHEALIRRLKKGQPLPEINSAVDLNNFFSVRHVLPMGLYDLDQIEGERIEIRVGEPDDAYEGINGRTMGMEGKLLSADKMGAFGSPIVDSKRTMVTEKTTDAIHLLYFSPSTPEQVARTMLDQCTTQFLHIHGGKASNTLIP